MPVMYRFFVLAVLFVALAFAVVWGMMAIWFKAPGADWLIAMIVLLYGLVGVGGITALLGKAPRRWMIVFVVVFSVVLGWWNTLQPPSAGNWSPELARQATGEIRGDILTIENVRTFEWRTSDDFTEGWETRSYDLSKLKSVDLFLSYWGGPAMAHFMLSFGFEDGQYLPWSIEVRRRADDSFSPISDFFKAHPIAIIVSEEQDVIGIRTNIWKNDVRIFRLILTKDDMRILLEAYVSAANEISQRPHWFNSVFTNCSRTSVLIARSAGIYVPVDWRIIVNGYLPDYLYDIGAIDTDMPLETLYELGSISTDAQETGLSDDFSSAIRQRLLAHYE